LADHKKAPPEGEAGLFMGEEIYLAELQADFSAAQQLFCAAHSVVFSVEQAFFSEQAAFFAEHSVLLAEHSAFSPAYAENPATISATAAILSAFFIVCLLKGFNFILVSLTLVLRLCSIKTEFFSVYAWPCCGAACGAGQASRLRYGGMWCVLDFGL
jgi:hypothetical protein